MNLLSRVTVRGSDVNVMTTLFAADTCFAQATTTETPGRLTLSAQIPRLRQKHVIWYAKCVTAINALPG